MSDTTTRLSNYPRKQATAYLLIFMYAVLAIANIVLLFLTRNLSFTEGFGFRGFQLAISLPLFIVAILAVRTQANNLLGWLLMGTAPISLLTEIGMNYYLYGTRNNPGIPYTDVAVWLTNWAWIPATVVFLTLFPLLFPDGKTIGRRWNLIGWVAVAWGIIAMGVLMFLPEIFNLSEPIPNVFALALFADLSSTGVSSFFAISFIIPSVLAVISLIICLKQANLITRQQLKWGMITVLFAVPLPIIGNSDTLMGDVFLGLLAVLVPVALGISILRYRLWDVDILINRSLVYGALTAILASLFALDFAILSIFVRHMEQKHAIIALVIAALIFGFAFQPARYRLQKLVDQHIYNINIDWQRRKKIESDTNPQLLAEAGVADYKDMELIGEGGMAKVFKASHPDYDHPVAIKVLPSRLAKEEQFTIRFEREAQTIQRLDHPNIIKLYNYGQEDERHYMVMEYLNGADMAVYLKEHGAFLYHKAMPLVEQISSALDYAHEEGLVHRDIKPSNVMLDNQNGGQRAVLMDFGIAKILDKTAMTNTGSMLGSFDYIAPEQIQGSESVDRRADIYSFGVMTYQMLTGRTPFKVNNPAAMLMAHLNQPAPDPREFNKAIPASTAEALLKALAKLPEARQGSVGEIVAGFEI